MSPAAPDRERRLGRIAGILGLGSAAAVVAAMGLSSAPAAGDPGQSGEDARSLLLTVSTDETQQLIGAGLRALALVLLLGVVLFLFRAVRVRNPDHAVLIPIAGAVGALLLAAATLAAFLEVRTIADEFARGSLTSARADSLLDAGREGVALRLSHLTVLVAALLLGIWIALVSYEGMQVGLLTRFLCVFGIGAGAATVMGLAEASQALFLGWLVSVSLLALDRWPGGRPPAWCEGRAVRWAEVDQTVVRGRGGL